MSKVDKHLPAYTVLHYQKTAIFIIAAVKTANPAEFCPRRKIEELSALEIYMSVLHIQPQTMVQ